MTWKTITMSELRAEPGERLIDIRRDRTHFVLTRGAKPAAKLVPVDCACDCTVVERDGTIRGPMPLTFRMPRALLGA